MYSLKRIKPDDGAGISDGWSVTLVRVEPAKHDPCIEYGVQGPREGWVIHIDSPSRWYHTSIVTEILSEEENDERVLIVFKTLNSTYEFRRFK